MINLSRFDSEVYVVFLRNLEVMCQIKNKIKFIKKLDYEIALDVKCSIK